MSIFAFQVVQLRESCPNSGFQRSALFKRRTTSGDCAGSVFH